MKRLSITVSAVSMCGDNSKKGQNVQIYDDKDFAKLENCKDAYCKSKVIQETIIRDYIDNHPNDSVEIVTLHPGMIVGPTLISGKNSTAYLMSKIMRGVPNPRVSQGLVDIRDVA